VLNPNAATFTPRHVPVMIKGGGGHFLTEEDFQSIAAHFRTLNWPTTVVRVYITNGWHQAFEGGVWVNHCDYRPNSMTDPVEHYYA
jgi:hypothetical protein